MNRLEEKYNRAERTPSDIDMFIPTLRQYSEACEHVTEFGVRWIVSTWGLLSGLPKRMVSYDINHPEVHGANINEVYEIAEENGVKYDFHLASTLEVEIEPTELLFIDTDHTNEHLIKELNLHHSRVRYWIMCHDTVAFNLMPAVNEFIETHKEEWKIKEHMEIHPGMVILERIN